MDKVISRKQRQFNAHRQEILAVALELFSSQGFEQTTMAQIAHRAEFAVGTLYKFFKDKKALYHALVTETLMEAQHHLLAALHGTTKAVEKIRHYIDTVTALSLQHAATARLYFSVTAGAIMAPTAGLERKVLEINNRLLADLEAVFRDGTRLGQFVDLPPRLLTISLQGIVHGFLSELAENPHRWTHDQAAESIKRVFLGGAAAKYRSADRVGLLKATAHAETIKA